MHFAPSYTAPDAPCIFKQNYLVTGLARRKFYGTLQEVKLLDNWYRD